VAGGALAPKLRLQSGRLFFKFLGVGQDAGPSSEETVLAKRLARLFLTMAVAIGRGNSQTDASPLSRKRDRIAAAQWKNSSVIRTNNGNRMAQDHAM